jgi:pimeloyl-ACP methyl ester carboxylesterase
MTTDRMITLASGRSLFARQLGSGSDVVLLHGALTTAHDWEAAPLTALARRHRLTIVDRPGHGKSERPRLAGTPRDQARQILAGLDTFGVERPLVVGHSFGAMAALAMAEERPSGLSGLVLVSPLAFPEPRPLEHGLLAPMSVPGFGDMLSWAAARAPFGRTMVRLVQRLMFDPAPVPSAWQASFPFDDILTRRSIVAEGEDSASMLPFSPAGTIDFSRVTLPVHILTGTADRIVEDERQAKALARLLPQARLTEIEGAGHMLHHTHPAALESAISDITDTRAAA